jgi:D-tyrosyl-tRNA(Tyr) deacylase
MRAVIQRVKSASLIIKNKKYSEIGTGLLIFFSIEDTDNAQDIEWLSNKIARLRIFDDEKGIMNLSIRDVKGELMIVSQFTLHASTKKGNRPSYTKASKPEYAIPIYEKFVGQLALNTQVEIKTGQFGADMKVKLINDGPVTILIDTKNKE